MTANINGFENLLRNIKSTIYEGILKLGIVKGESFGIYYELDLLNYLLGTDCTNAESMLENIKDFNDFSSARLIPITIRKEGSRFRFIASGEGVEQISKDTSSTDFLRSLIALVNTHKFDLEQVQEVFKASGQPYSCKEVDNPEFEYVFSFSDQNFDPFFYCFHIGQGHSHYHRLLEFSYRKLFD
ncbi:DUF3877 family protein [Anaerocolumna sp. AGMB13020]|uniref:DUF3877 family protein n=1 Tax=Anaerocolumna sp. AGMB13020 TaxID=3081750 RepID=UPI0029551668|nr:DUF3877 family protein [Anaerocolumna sp. AGMB13020]WOO35559.1 DUF3877 family protein [Anaerocolumna sp. AGMB13020]